MLLLAYIGAIFHHMAGWASVLSTVSTYMPDRVKSRFGLKREQRVVTFVIAALFLYVAGYQVWLDEHHNTDQVAREKAEFSKEREFWKDQSYQKDGAVRSRDNLLSQNFTTLTQSQQQYNEMTKKVLEMKPEPLNYVLVQEGSPPNPQPGYTLQHYLIIPNRVVLAKGQFSCGVELTDVHTFVAGTANTFIGGSQSGGGNMLMADNTIVQIDILSPNMGPTSPLSISFLTKDSSKITACHFRPM